jgi:hypothetical protein
MINKEEFKKLVQSSISYSSNGFPYFILEDTVMICPFCKKELKNKKISGEFQITCDCDNSKKFADLYLNHLKIIEKEKFEIFSLEKDINKLSLEFFKDYFKIKIIPELKEEFNKNIDEILNC